MHVVTGRDKLLSQKQPVMLKLVDQPPVISLWNYLNELAAHREDLTRPSGNLDVEFCSIEDDGCRSTTDMRSCGTGVHRIRRKQAYGLCVLLQ